jgi:hypothetical protein
MAVKDQPIKSVRNPDYMTRAEFISGMAKVAGHMPILWLPAVSETSTSTDAGSPTGHGKVITYSKDVSTWDTTAKYLGQGIDIKFDGVDEEADTPDHAEFSNTLDVMSWMALVKLTDATSSTIISKFDITTSAEVREWLFQFDSADKLTMEVWDESAAARIGQTSDTAVTEGEWALYSGTYDGGITSSGVLLYKNGLVLQSSADETGTFVSGEDLGAVVSIGDYEGTGGSNVDFMDGSMGFVMMSTKELGLAQHGDIVKLVNKYFDLSL